MDVLFVAIILGVWVPLVVLIVVIALAAARGGLGPQAAGSGGGVQLITTLVTFLFVLYLLVVFTYLVYKWYVDMRWRDVAVRWQTRLWPSCGFILGQVLLSVVTAFIYFPAAFLRVYRYFAARTILTKEGAEIGRGGFDGALGKGFGLIWGQALLSMITLGFSLPWAYASIGRWLVGSTFVERKAA